MFPGTLTLIEVKQATVTSILMAFGALFWCKKNSGQN